ncbi:MAG: Fic family protein [Fimbriimonadaceae bacterium]|nr:Fic family protein [Fimbriimonadaceae bacterium]
MIPDLVQAHRGLGQVQMAAQRLPNQEVLIRTLILQEAKLSSEVENIVTTNDEVYQAFSGDVEEMSPNLKEVLRYGDAVWFGYQEIKRGRPISPSLMTDLVERIKGSPVGIRSMTGTRVANSRTGEIIYSPPEGKDRIIQLMDALCRFLSDTSSADPLIRLAAGHYQFEAIHPFPDGNGRAGRVINVLFLIQEGLLDLPLIYPSRQILNSKSEYYDLLRGVTERGEWEAWLRYMLRAIRDSAKDSIELIDSILDLMAADSERLKSEAPRLYSRELVELIYSQPYTRIAGFEEAGLGNRQTASSHLNRLTEMGLLVRVQAGRNVLFLNPKMIRLFAGP